MEGSWPFLMDSATGMDDAHCRESGWPCPHLANSRYNSVYPGIPIPRYGRPLAAVVSGHDYWQIYHEETRSAYARVARMAACKAPTLQGFLFRKQRVCKGRLSLIMRPNRAC